MNPMLIESLGWVLVHSWWQFAAVAAVAGVAVQALRQSSAAARYGVLVGAMGLMVAGPVATWGWQQADERAASHGSSIAAVSERDLRPESDTGNVPADDVALQTRQDVSPALVADAVNVPRPADEASSIEVVSPAGPNLLERTTAALRPWLAWIVAAWSVGVMLCSARPLFGWYTLRRLKRVGVSPVSKEVLAALGRVSKQLGLPHSARLLQSTLAQVPIVLGYFRPVILLPVSLVTSIPSAQLEAILAHELVHVRRHDFAVNLVQTLVETLFFYHPAVWWLSRRIRVEREHCCDDLVVRVLGNRVEYGRALVAIAQLRGHGTVLALGATDGLLLSRVRRIVGLKSDQGVRSPWSLLSLVACCLAAVLAIVVPPLRYQSVRFDSKELTDGRDDVGTLALKDGVRPRGRVLDADGTPLAGIQVQAVLADKQPGLDAKHTSTGANAYRRAAVTRADGSFEFAPVERGTYQVTFADTLASSSKPRAMKGVLTARSVVLDAMPHEFKAVPAVELRVRNIDSRGRPRKTLPFRVLGNLADGRTSEINHIVTCESREDGRCIARLPQGLRRLEFTANEDPRMSFRVTKSTVPLHRGDGIFSSGRLGLPSGTALDRDVEIELTWYSAPQLAVQVVDQAKVVTDAAVNLNYGGQPAKQSDVEFDVRNDLAYSESLLPDEVFTVTADKGDRFAAQSLKLAEGEQRAVVLVLQAAPAASDNPLRSVKAARGDQPRGAFTGRIVITGPRPQLPPLTTRAGKTVPDESLLLSKDGGLANAVVYLRNRPAPWQPTDPPREPVEIRAEDDAFRPRMSLIRVGQSLRIRAPLKESTNFKLYPRKSNGFNVLVKPNEFKDWPPPFTESEPLPLAIDSNLHPWCKAWLLALDHPFAAVTDANGRFAIHDLPTGEHEFVLWHERSGWLIRKLRVSAEPGLEIQAELAFPADDLNMEKERRPAGSFRLDHGAGRLQPLPPGQPPPAAPDARSGIQAIPPRLEFRFAAQPSDSQFEPRVPADYEQRDYSGNSVIGRMVAKDKRFIWAPVNESKDRIAALPVERLRGGQVREALLADTPEHALAWNGKWAIDDCRVVPDPNNRDRSIITLKLNEAGGAALKALTKSHLNQPLAILVNNEIITAPVVREEFGGVIAIAGNFSREQADKLVAALRPAADRPNMPDQHGAADQPEPAPALATTATAPPKNREQVGEVLGQPVYRDELQGKSLHDIFLGPVWTKYRDAHRAAITPTDAEIKFASDYFDREHRQRIEKEGGEAKLREQLQALEARLARTDLPQDEAKKLELEQLGLQQKLRPPSSYGFARFVLNNWKFQKHLYDHFGGGRILFQQAGLEAFDATRTCLESFEKQGEFKITDPTLRPSLYEYWTRENHPGLLTDKETIRKQFLEPEWVAPAAVQEPLKAQEPGRDATNVPSGTPLADEKRKVAYRSKLYRD